MLLPTTELQTECIPHLNPRNVYCLPPLSLMERFGPSSSRAKARNREEQLGSSARDVVKSTPLRQGLRLHTRGIRIL